MRQGDKKTFIQKNKLYAMLNLRLNGLAMSSLALLFGVDRSSIAYQCEKYQIGPQDDSIYTIERIISQIIPKQNIQYKIVNGEKINLGKSYKDYLISS